MLKNFRKCYKHLCFMIYQFILTPWVYCYVFWLKAVLMAKFPNMPEERQTRIIVKKGFILEAKINKWFANY